MADTAVQETKKGEVIQAQPGFQTRCLSSKADITVIGGGAGAGKTTVFILDGIRCSLIKGHRGITFRKHFNQISMPGGLYDESFKFYSLLTPTPGTVKNREFVFANGSTETFAHISREAELINWQGGQFSVIRFDQLEHFNFKEFFYMLSRNRSACGIRPYMIASCNPQGEGWVKDLVSWYLYPDDYHDEDLSGYPIPHRSGVLRYFLYIKGVLFWGNNREEVLQTIPTEFQGLYKAEEVKSFTFIAGTLADNEILNLVDPAYRSNLLALPQEEQEQLLGGRWKKYNEDALLIINTKAALDALTNSFVPKGEMYLTADPSLEGADDLPIVIWSGWRAEKIIIIDKTDGKKALETIMGIADRINIPHRNVCFDGTGIGDYISGWMPTAFNFKGASSPIITPEEQARRDKAKRENRKFEGEDYLNIRAQCIYYLARMYRENRVYAAIPDDLRPRYLTEVQAIRKGERTDGKLSVQPKILIKRKIGFSPGLMDVFSMRAVFDLLPKPKKYSRMMAGVI